jgi:hypothetical protein
VQTPPEVDRLQLRSFSGIYQAAVTPELVVEEGEPVTIDIEEFQYAYKCKHCGHSWSEKHVEEHVENPKES